MRSILTAIMAALSLVSMSLVLTACPSTGTAPPVLTPEKAQSAVEKLDIAWAVADSLAATYAMLKPETAAAIDRARALAEPIVQEARAQILAASGDVSIEQRALQAGLAALAIFRAEVIAARAKPPAG